MTVGSLSAQQRKEILVLVDVCEREDGVSPLNDDARFNLENSRGHHLALRVHDQLAGYCHVDQHGHAVIAVAPHLRRRGIGSQLVRQAAQAGASGAWAFGTLPAAVGLADACGARGERSLLIMGKDLADTPPPPLPDGVSIAGFSEADADDVLSINRTAFAHHPEQGALTADEFAERRRAPWFRADGLLVARRHQTVVGFHWLKLHGDGLGEVYVLATSPAAQGTGVGRALLEQGLAWLREQGCRRALLFVDAAETVPVRLYEKTGFSVDRRDTYYAWEELLTP